MVVVVRGALEGLEVFLQSSSKFTQIISVYFFHPTGRILTLQVILMCVT